MQKPLARIVDIWSQRGVFDPGFVEKLQKAMGRHNWLTQHVATTKFC